MEASECKASDDVVKFLTSRMMWIPHPPTQKGWVQQFGYRHYYWIQQVWFNPATDQYAFHSDEFDSWDTTKLPNLGMYNSFQEMLQGVANYYVRLWGISASDVTTSGRASWL